MKLFSVLIYFMLTNPLIGQKGSLEDMLWKEAGGRIDITQDYGGQYEIIDDAKNGYLKIAFTEDGCGCYRETIVAAYKDNKRNYTTLKTEWDGCRNKKSLSSNRALEIVFPKDFSVNPFLQKEKKYARDILIPVLYLGVILPRKGTDTKADLNYIPFGISMYLQQGIISYEGYQHDEYTSEYSYFEKLQSTVRELTENASLKHIINQNIDKICIEDRIIIKKLYKEGSNIESFQDLSSIFKWLESYYKISKQIENQSIILGWNSEEARFYIKEKIKSDLPELSFLEFIQQLPFLMAVC